MLRCSRLWDCLLVTGIPRMRFDPPDGASIPSSSTITDWVTKASADVPPSMRAKTVRHDFTPYPLPLYDSTMGFGPTTLSGSADVLKAKKRLLALEQEERSEQSEMTAAAGDAQPSFSEGYRYAFTSPYVVAGDLKVMDRLECQRSVDELAAQLHDRPHREAQTATVLDYASTIPQRSNEEIQKMLYELSSLFSVDSNGLQFLVAKVVKYGRPYFVTSELMKAFTVLLDAATQFYTASPHRLSESIDVCIQLLHLLALMRVLEPNTWFSPNPLSPSNRADYAHPRGVNFNTAFRQHGVQLFQMLENLVASNPPLLRECSLLQLIELLNGFAAVSTADAMPSSAVLDVIWVHAAPQLSDSQIRGEWLEKLYFTLSLVRSDQKKKAVREVLYQKAGYTCGADFFSAASQESDGDLRAAIAQERLSASLKACAASRDEKELLGIVEGSRELLMSLTDKAVAVHTAQAFEYDSRMLSSLPHFETVAARLQAEASDREDCLRSFLAVDPSVGLTTMIVGGKLTRRRGSSYLTTFNGKRVHPIRTLLSDLYYTYQLSGVYVLHSSCVTHSLDAMLAALRKARGGSEAVVCTSSFLHALALKAQYARGGRSIALQKKQMEVASRALSVLSYEIQMGRVIVVPFVEELAIHDAGAVCDEDLLMWTICAFFAREMPLVKVHTLQHAFSTARQPHHTLKAAHSPLRRANDLYNRSMPLLASLSSKNLRAVTHHVRLQQPVLDRNSKLHKVNPIRARFLYRRDGGLYDKQSVDNRNIAPGFAQGALSSDLRGLGFYTPDHPQPLYPTS